MAKSLGYAFRLLQGGRGPLLQEQRVGPSAGAVVGGFPQKGLWCRPTPHPAPKGQQTHPALQPPSGVDTALDESRFKGDGGARFSPAGALISVLGGVRGEGGWQLFPHRDLAVCLSPWDEGLGTSSLRSPVTSICIQQALSTAPLSCHR
ncbi:hypothetical protein E2I00_013457, partial [Balaenoptera physalus]